MGAWETDGYNMSINPYWVNKDKSGGGGGSDIPTPEYPGQVLTNDGEDLEWADIEDLLPTGNRNNLGVYKTSEGIGVTDGGALWIGPKSWKAYSDDGGLFSGVLNNVKLQAKYRNEEGWSYVKICPGNELSFSLGYSKDGVMNDPVSPLYCWNIMIPTGLFRDAIKCYEDTEGVIPEDIIIASAPVFVNNFQCEWYDYTDPDNPQTMTESITGYIFIEAQFIFSESANGELQCNIAYTPKRIYINSDTGELDSAAVIIKGWYPGDNNTGVSHTAYLYYNPDRAFPDKRI